MKAGELPRLDGAGHSHIRPLAFDVKQWQGLWNAKSAPFKELCTCSWPLLSALLTLSVSRVVVRKPLDYIR